MSPKAWMPLYVGDFLVGTMGWKPVIVGHYIRLLCVNWDKGSIPLSPTEWDYISSGASEYADVLCEKFPIKHDARCNLRVEEEMKKASDRYKRRCEAGKKGAERRWGDDNTPTPISQGESPLTTPARPVVIDRGARDAKRAWEHVPMFRRQGFKGFLRTWERQVLQQHIDADTVVDAFAGYYNSPQGRGKYCKGPIKLLEGGVWDDDAESWKHLEADNKESMTMLDEIMEAGL